MSDWLFYSIGVIVAFVTTLLSMYFTNKTRHIDGIDIYWAIVLSLFSWVSAISAPIFLFLFKCKFFQK